MYINSAFYPLRHTFRFTNFKFLNITLKNQIAIMHFVCVVVQARGRSEVLLRHDSPKAAENVPLRRQLLSRHRSDRQGGQTLESGSGE